MKTYLSCLVMGLCALASAAADHSQKLHRLFDEHWQITLKEDPEFASYLGDKRYNDKWPDLSIAAIERRNKQDQDYLKALASIDQSKLSEEDRLNYALFKRQLEDNIEKFQFQRFLVPLSQSGGIQTSNQIVQALNFTAMVDYENWIKRLTSFPVMMEQTIELMREGMRVGMLHPKVIMERLPDQVKKHLVDDPQKSLYYAPFLTRPKEISAEEFARLTKRAEEAIVTHIVPAFRKFHAFIVNDYIAACFDQVGVWQVSRGEEFYALLARQFTTTKLTPNEIHEIGLREVARIRKEMEVIIKKVGFKGTFSEFLTFLRTDPQFYYTDPKELLAAYREISKRIDPTLVKLFKKLPRMPYGVDPIPDHIASDETTAYYNRPAADGSRAGVYFVNLYKPETRPKFEMEALSIHEAVPGHHLQIALASEMGELPEFRRHVGFTAFVEGWALYSESLGEELGFYTDPYSKFGQLTYEMWRAVRLVVDTGIHSKKWTRKQAIDYFMANAGKSEHDIVNEIDRYISWPGQALAYKIGELKIKELRERAKKQLGNDFDVRDFHDVVLGAGAIPLDILEARVNEWITKSRNGF